MIVDTLTALRPDIILYSTPAEAAKAAAAIEQKFRAKIGTDGEEGGVEGGDDSDEEEIGIVDRGSQEDLDEEEEDDGEVREGEWERDIILFSQNEPDDGEDGESDLAEMDTFGDDVKNWFTCSLT